jgi:hypothetical protein
LPTPHFPHLWNMVITQKRRTFKLLTGATSIGRAGANLIPTILHQLGVMPMSP